jgi:hypothetical protein
MNEGGPGFVSAVSSFLWMNKEQLGSDPTTMKTATNVI